ncbi:MAG: vWA domain-containing protein [Planctomycetota bacterium]
MSTLQVQNPTASTADSEDAVGESTLWTIFDAVPAWGVSLLIHVAIILLVAMISLPEIVLPELNLTTTVETEELQQVEYVLDTEPTDALGTKSDLNIASPSAAVAQDRGLDNHREEIARIEDVVNPQVAVFEPIASPNEATMLENIDLTGTTEHAGGTEGAVDRITLEIASSLRQRKTLPVWLFDESLSLEARREQIIARFENVYRQLGLMDDIDTKDALKSGIIGFGKDIHVLVDEPTSDVAELTKAVKSISSDVSGAENVFAAIQQAIKTYGPVSKKMRANMMLIIVTDERGDDFGGDSFAILEETVKRLARSGVKVYVVGNSSPFGRQKGLVHMTWKDEEGTAHEGDLEADQGPESPLPEGLQLPFWTSNAAGLEHMSSGYGPYTLSRLCSETGGIFFIADDTNRIKWDPMIMRQYAPDYRPGTEYRRQLQGNLAKQALIAAAQLAVREPVPNIQKQFSAYNDNVLREEITESQKPLAVLDYFLAQVHTTLEAGEKDRDKLDSDRWRASYDLAMGRILAMRVRAFGYNSILAEMKASPKKFENSDSNQWVLQPSESMNAGANIRRMHDKAVEYLNRVIDEHPDTPWALMAKMEISEPLGWEWKEGRMAVPAMQNGNGDAARRPQFAPEEEQRRRQAAEMARKREASKPKI